MEDKALQIFQQIGIAKTEQFNYSEIANSFNSNGYTSLAGNTYFNSIWFVDGLAILADIGVGHTWTFLNGLRIVNIQDKKLIYDGRYHCSRYQKTSVISTVTKQVTQLILESGEKEGVKFDPVNLQCKVQSIVEAGFNKDQRYMLNYNNQKFLNA